MTSNNYQPNLREVHVFLQNLLGIINQIAEHLEQQNALKAKEQSLHEKLYDACDIAEHFKVSTRTVQRWIKDGAIPGFKVKRKWYCPKQVIDEILEQQVSIPSLYASSHTPKRVNGAKGRKNPEC